MSQTIDPPMRAFGVVQPVYVRAANWVTIMPAVIDEFGGLK